MLRWHFVCACMPTFPRNLALRSQYYSSATKLCFPKQACSYHGLLNTLKLHLGYEVHWGGGLPYIRLQLAEISQGGNLGILLLGFVSGLSCAALKSVAFADVIKNFCAVNITQACHSLHHGTPT